MTDKQIIQALIAHDEGVTRQFFFKDCRPLFIKVIRFVFDYPVDYDEFVNEFYLYLLEEDARRLRQFEGRSTIYQWLKMVAIRYFVAKRDRLIDMESQEPLLESRDEESCDQQELDSRMELEALFALMSNKRQVYVIKKLVLEDAEPQKVADELQVTVENLYNIKKRAIAALTKIAINEAEKYGKRNGK